MNKNKVNAVCRKFGFEVHGTGYIQAIKKSSFREDPFQKQQEFLSGKAAVILDIGANYGDTVLKYHEYFPNANIYAFEPFPNTYSGLIQKVGHLSQVKTFESAISDHMGKAVFYVNRNVDTNSLLPSQKMGLSSDHEVQFREKIDVELNTIDQFCMVNKIQGIDILKLDIQGGELDALKGAKSQLEEKKIKLIYTESYFRPQYVNQPLFYDIANFLKQFGYYLQDIYQPIYGNGSIAWCDAIFLPQ